MLFKSKLVVQQVKSTIRAICSGVTSLLCSSSLPAATLPTPQESIKQTPQVFFDPYRLQPLQEKHLPTLSNHSFPARDFHVVFRDSSPNSYPPTHDSPTIFPSYYTQARPTSYRDMFDYEKMIALVVVLAGFGYWARKLVEACNRDEDTFLKPQQLCALLPQYQGGLIRLFTKNYSEILDDGPLWQIAVDRNKESIRIDYQGGFLDFTAANCKAKIVDGNTLEFTLKNNPPIYQLTKRRLDQDEIDNNPLIEDLLKL